MNLHERGRARGELGGRQLLEVELARQCLQYRRPIDLRGGRWLGRDKIGRPLSPATPAGRPLGWHLEAVEF